MNFNPSVRFKSSKSVIASKELHSLCISFNFVFFACEYFKYEIFFQRIFYVWIDIHISFQFSLQE